ncbi:MAG: F0F1 ATP synthase subunit A [Gemmatimonadota bacterium]
MELSPDAVVYWQWGFVKLNATLVFTWATMAVLVGCSWLITRRIRGGVAVLSGQAFLEMLLEQIRDQIRDATQDEPDKYLPVIGTLFLFIATASLLGVVPGVHVPTASLSTTSALALLVFIVVPAYGIEAKGFKRYLASYTRPTVFMLPFNMIGEVSRTVALSVRLFGNMMSGHLIVAVLLTIVPILFPALLQAFGLLIGFIQAYVFAILALVYIASGTRVIREERTEGPEEGREEGPPQAS